MDRENTTVGIIKTIIWEETKYLRHYYGQVIDNLDIESKGKVKVLVPELGWDTPFSAAWATPRQLHSMTVPLIGEYVEIYFMGGDAALPVYIGQMNDMLLQLPNAFDGKPTTHVPFESPLLKSFIKFDDLLGKIILDALFIEIGAGAVEPMVLGTQLQTFLTTLVTTVYNLHVHTITDPISGPLISGPPNPTTVAPAGILSLTETCK
jgi:hypothetical protein